MIDGHKLEKQAMELFKRGDGARATLIQDEFLAEVMGSGEDLCSCPEACKLHGKCVECVLIHRGHGDHLPRCFDPMLSPGAPK
jgi:hypothetical protein